MSRSWASSIIRRRPWEVSVTPNSWSSVFLQCATNFCRWFYKCNYYIDHKEPSANEQEVCGKTQDGGIQAALRMVENGRHTIKNMVAEAEALTRRD
uniref:Uncharacterized protein n=1 Tax=Leersia perrieri TaxID=77586 RepID=A0A0D9V704_9ORYZ